MAQRGEDVYCTLLMSDSYLPGAAVLAHSLRDAGTKKKLAVLVTLDLLAADTITELKTLYDYIIPVDRIANPKPSNLYVMGRPDLNYTFTKINVWRQMQFRRIVYIDSDVVALRAPDELFDLPHNFAAAPDVGWPDAFNSGVMMLKPDMGEYWALHTMAVSGDSFDGADQGLLNQYYQHRPWHRFSFTYNCTPNAEYQWEPAYRYYKSGINMVHFIGKNKPWFQGRSTQGGVGTYSELVARWWIVYDRHYKAPTTAYIQGQAGPAPRIVQKHVTGEATNVDYGYTSLVAPPSVAVHEASDPMLQSDAPLMEPLEPAEQLQQGLVEPTSTFEQRRFSAPQMEWDATRSAPPADARPEALNFPTQSYEFSESTELFHPPRHYPEPPKDMWYKVPDSRKQSVDETPKPIFPWEQKGRQAPPTRVFAEDRPPTPEPIVPPTTESTKAKLQESNTVVPPAEREQTWQKFSARTENAWDSIPGIDNYARYFEQALTRRLAPTNIALPNPSGAATGSAALDDTDVEAASAAQTTEEILSPTPTRRRESMILTNFPTSDERPSLPVTPAPIRRDIFWGSDKDNSSSSGLPAAEGVPDQHGFDPARSLEQLRKNSLLEQPRSDSSMAKEAPRREMVRSSVSLPSGGTGIDALTSPSGGGTAATARVPATVPSSTAPVVAKGSGTVATSPFRTVNFDEVKPDSATPATTTTSDGPVAAREDALSPLDDETV